MEIFLDPAFYTSLFILTLLEIVLGIDNIIVIAILVNKLPVSKRKSAQFIGLSLAMVSRILLLLTLSWLAHLTTPLFTIKTFNVTGRDLILFFGGVFLVYKAIKELVEHLLFSEIKEKIAHLNRSTSPTKSTEKVNLPSMFGRTLVQIVFIDIIFSLDSVITAIGVANEIVVMILAVVVSIIIMMTFATAISNFISKYQSLKVLALTFLILIGFILIGDGIHFHVDKSYVYVAMAFSLVVNLICISYEKRYTAFKAKYDLAIEAVEKKEREEEQALNQ